MSEKSLRIDRGTIENIVSIVPPLSELELDTLLKAGVVSETMVGAGDLDGEPATAIHFGRLIMGTVAMDQATNKLAYELREHLAA